MIDIDGLPGADLVREGLEDLARGRVTVPALLVSIGAPRLRALGLEVTNALVDADHRLYLLLADELGDAAHGRYNALLRSLSSFARAAECAR